MTVDFPTTQPTMASRLADWLDNADQRDAVDLFAGPGGWDVAAQRLGINTLGIEWDGPACATREAVGHLTLQADIAALDPRQYAARGLIASPPCQGFSMAGKGRGRADSVMLLERIADVHTRADLELAIADLHEHMTDDKTLLALEPLRWALTFTPGWLAWEQVPGVLPIWEACAVILRRIGYTVETGTLSTEQYGVPQTRKRAILVARAPWLTKALGPVALPTPTHSKYHNRTPDRFDEGVLPWVSMEDALGWVEPVTVVSNYSHGGDLARRGERHGDQPSATITSKADRSRVELRMTTMPNNARRTSDRPAPTIAFGHDSASAKWFPAEDAINNQSGTEYDIAEQVAGPAPAIAGRDLVTFRGANANRFNGATKSRNDGIRIDQREAAVLQTFPGDYPWQGNKGAVFQQIGNAIPPLFAEAILRAVTGRTPAPFATEVVGP